MSGIGCAFTYFCNGYGLSYTFFSICGELDAALNPRLIVPACTLLPPVFQRAVNTLAH